MSDPTTSLHTYLTTALTSGFVGQTVAMLDHRQGHDNLLWRVDAGGQQAVVKLFMDAGQARSRRQYGGQQLFAPLGLAPIPLWYDRYPEGLSRQVLVYRWVDGEPVAAQDTQTLLLLAQTVARMHSHPADEAPRFSPRPFSLDYFWRVLAGGFAPIQVWLERSGAPMLADRFARLTNLAQQVVEAALPAAQRAAPAPVHGDLKLENCLSSWGSVVLVDWEMFGLGDPALVVAGFLHASRAEIAPAEGKVWMDLYVDAICQPELRSRIDAYRRLLPLQDLSFLLAGLRNLSPADRAQPEFAAAAGFLEETLLAGVTATSALLPDVDSAESMALAPEFRALLAGDRIDSSIH